MTSYQGSRRLIDGSIASNVLPEGETAVRIRRESGSVWSMALASDIRGLFEQR